MKNSQIPKCKTITFAGEVTVVPIPPRSEMTKQEIQDQYINRAEMKNIRRRCLKLAQKIENGHAKHACSRGLENHISTGAALSEFRREQIYDTVFAVQRLTSGTDSSAILARMYKTLSADSIRAACVVAQRDAKEASGSDYSTFSVPLPTMDERWTVHKDKVPRSPTRPVNRMMCTTTTTK